MKEPWIKTRTGEISNVTMCGNTIRFAVMTERDAAIHLSYPQVANILLDQGDSRSILTLYDAKLYIPSYARLALQVVAYTENLLDFSRVRVIEVKIDNNLISVVDSVSSTVLLSLPLAPFVKFEVDKVHTVRMTALKDSLWKFEKPSCLESS